MAASRGAIRISVEQLNSINKKAGGGIKIKTKQKINLKAKQKGKQRTKGKKSGSNSEKDFLIFFRRRKNWCATGGSFFFSIIKKRGKSIIKEEGPHFSNLRLPCPSKVNKISKKSKINLTFL